MGVSAIYGVASEEIRRALKHAAEKLGAEWDGTECAACGGAKWAKHPFCRTCSMALQRAGLMRNLKPFCGHDFRRIGEWEAWMRWALRFDTARDFLIVRKTKALKPAKNTETVLPGEQITDD